MRLFGQLVSICNREAVELEQSIGSMLIGRSGPARRELLRYIEQARIEEYDRCAAGHSGIAPRIAVDDSSASTHHAKPARATGAIRNFPSGLSTPAA